MLERVIPHPRGEKGVDSIQSVFFIGHTKLVSLLMVRTQCSETTDVIERGKALSPLASFGRSALPCHENFARALLHLLGVEAKRASERASE